MEKYGFVYIWYDRKHKRYYIGCHWGNIDDGYVCSSNWMRDAYKRRPEDFKRRILTNNISERHLIYPEEFKWLSLIKSEELGKRYYNLQIDDLSSKDGKKIIEGLQKRDNKSHSPEVREKRRQSMIKTMAKKFPQENRHNSVKFNSPEYIENMKNKSAERWKDPEYKKRVGESITKANLGKPRTGNSAKGCVWFNNGIINIKRKEHPGEGWIKGKLYKINPMERDKYILENKKEIVVGKVLSEETKNKMSEKRKNYWKNKKENS